MMFFSGKITMKSLYCLCIPKSNGVGIYKGGISKYLKCSAVVIFEDYEIVKIEDAS